MQSRLLHKYVVLCVVILIGIGAQVGWTAGKEEFSTLEDKVSYIIGHQFISNLKRQGLDVQLEAIMKGIQDALTGQTCAFNMPEQNTIMNEFKAKRMANRADDAGSQASGDSSWKTKLTKPELMTFDANTEYFWILETNKGNITIMLMPDVAPMHVTSTIFLTKKGFYDNLTFHRVIPGFMAQGGCPLGTGTGGPGYQYAGEFDPKVKHDKPYLLSMANAGPNTDGSQFFLTFKPTSWLDNKHTIFGEITEGKDVMAKLEAAGTPSGKPKEKLLINKAKIEEKPKG